MNRLYQNRRGLTVVEMITAMVIFIAVMGGLYKLIAKNSTFFKRTQVRQQVVLDSRICIDRITQMMSNGRASTLIYSTPNSTPEIPNSRADFELQTPLASGTTAYAIYLQDGVVYALEYNINGVRQPQVLAKNVTHLNFTGDAQDPSIVGINLRIDAPYDSTNKPTNVTSLIVANHIVHMVQTP